MKLISAPFLMLRYGFDRSAAIGRHRCGARFLVMVCGSALAAVPAAAQINDHDDGPGLVGGILTTQITEGRAWTASIVVNTFYDNNFMRTSGVDTEAATRISPSIRAAAGLPVGQQQLFVGGNYGRDFTIGNPEFNRSRWSIGGGAGWHLGSRCSGVVGAETSQRLNLVFDQVNFSPNVRKTTAIAATANCQSSTGIGFGGSFGQINATNDRPERALFDVKTTQFAANIAYGNPTLGQFSLGASLNTNVYDQRFVVTADGFVQDGFNSVSGRLGYSRGLGARLQLSAGISYQTSNPKPTAVLQLAPDGQIIEVERETFSGNGFDLSLNYSASSRLSLNVTASRNIQASPNAGARFTIQQIYVAGINYKLGPSMSVSTGINYRTATYKDAFVSPDEPVARVNDKFTRYYATVSYSPAELYSISLQVAHLRRDSNPVLYSFKSTTAMLTLSTNFGKGQ